MHMSWMPAFARVNEHRHGHGHITAMNESPSRASRHVGTPPSNEECKSQILALAAILHSERAALTKVIAASLATTRLQIRASDQNVKAVKHKLASTRALLRLQFGHHLHPVCPRDSAAEPATSILHPKPSKVKVQNLLIRPEHLSRLPPPAPSSSSRPPHPANTSRHKRNEVVSAWEGSTYKKVLASSLAAKLLIKTCFLAIHHNAHTKRIVRQAAALCNSRRSKVLLRLCFRSLLFEALSMRYINLTSAARVAVLCRRKYLGPGVDYWLSFARYRKTLARLATLAATHHGAKLGIVGLQLLYWNRSRARTRRTMLLWAYKRCRSVRIAHSLYAWVLAYTRARGLKCLVAARAHRESKFARTQQSYLLYKGKKQYMYSGLDLSAKPVPPNLPRAHREEMAVLEATLLLLKRKLHKQMRGFARVGLSAEEVPDRDELNRHTSLAAMQPSFSLPIQTQGSFSFTSAAANSLDLTDNREMAGVRELLRDRVLSMSLSSLPREREHSRESASHQGIADKGSSRRFLSQTIRSSPPPKVRRSPSCGVGEEEGGEEPRDALFERVYGILAAELATEEARRDRGGVVFGTGLMLGGFGNVVGDAGPQGVEEDGFGPDVLLDLVSQRVRRVRRAVRTLRRHSNIRVSSRTLSLQSGVYCLRTAWIVWCHVRDKKAQMLGICASIGTKNAAIRSINKWYRIAVLTPKLRTKQVKDIHRSAVMRRSVHAWRKLYWLIAAVRQLTRMTRRDRVHAAFAGWKLSQQQRRCMHGLRNRIVRRTIRPIFRMWHIKVSTRLISLPFSPQHKHLSLCSVLLPLSLFMYSRPTRLCF